MQSTCQSVFEAALKLSEVERIRLVEQLLETLNPEAEGVFDDEWCAELDRRAAEFDAGTADAVDWSVLRDET
jgi:putative addiction module component (TIGR02574 family)